MLRLHLLHNSFAVAQITAPLGDGFQNGDQGFAKFGEGIFHPHGDFGIGLAVNDACFFQAFELKAQHLLGDVGNLFPQFPETHRLVAEVPKHYRLPFTADKVHGDVERAMIGFAAYRPLVLFSVYDHLLAQKKIATVKFDSHCKHTGTVIKFATVKYIVTYFLKTT
jgi:hypothetical protein